MSSSETIDERGFNLIYGIRCLFSPFNFTAANFKKGPTITQSASYGMDSCPFALVITFPHQLHGVHLIGYLNKVVYVSEIRQRDSTRTFLPVIQIMIVLSLFCICSAWP